MTRNYTQRTLRKMECSHCMCIFETRGNSTKMCKPCSKNANYRNRMLEYKWRIGKLFASAKYRAKDKNLPFNLTLEYLIGLWDKQDGKCSIVGIPFNLNSPIEINQVNPNAPSIDRIIPKLGYVQGNVRFVIYHVNVALSEYGEDSLIKLAKQLVAFRG
jgi:hypothetical protein